MNATADPSEGTPEGGATGVPPGVQSERTALAWQRTSLALAVGALGAGRLLEPLIGGVAWVLAGLGVLAAVLLARTGRHRTSAWSAVLDSASHSAGPGGGIVVATALGVGLLGAAALAVVLVG